MNAIFKQTDRMGTLSTILGKDVLNLLRFSGDEHLNGLFTYRVEALAKTDDLDFNTLISTHATVSLKSYDLPETPFDGIITEGEMLGQGENGWRYAFTLKPWFWLLGLRRKQQIYHEKTVVEILDELFAPYTGFGKPAVEKRLTGTYPTLEYTVQYRESDLDFATRLMERFGISYHFKHDVGSHTLVLTDTVVSHEDLPGASREFHMAENGQTSRDAEHFWDMRPSQRLTTGKIRLTDYNFKTPNAAMEVDLDGAAPYEEGSIESYDYPGDYLAQGAGKGVARLRVDQERGQDPRHRALGDCASLRAGHKVKVTGDKVPGVDKTLCLAAQHTYASGGYGTTENGEPSYEGSYLLMPADTPLAPERKTARPIVQGPQTAEVVGEGEIDCDEYGRILVRFHWDLDARHSMRCRVSQNWAGKGWGGMIVPRIGMEVVVEFLEGDPDKPLVTGCVYNGKNDTPYELPKHKTRSTFKTDTHKGRGYNELRFEDEKGEEEIYIHAQRDVNKVVLRDDLENIGRSYYQEIGKDSLTNIGRNSVHEAKGTVEIIGGRAVAISSGPIGITPKVFQGISASYSMIFDQAKFGLQAMVSAAATNGISLTAETSLMEHAGITRTSFTGVSSQEVVGKEKFTHVGSVHQIISGGTTIIVSADNTAIEAGDRIDLVCGESSIQMTADGVIKLKGKHIIADAGTIDLN